MASQADAPRKTLSRWDLIKSWLLWTFFSHSNYNYERMQATAFAQSMTPIINKLYTTKEEKAAALKRHLEFFNTEPNIGDVIHGVVIAMEEERANGADISDEAISSVKTGLMGPLAGIGDTWDQGTLVPILLAVGIGLGAKGSVMGPIIYSVLVAGIMWTEAWVLFIQGYRLGRQAVLELLQGGLIKRVVGITSILGTTVLGGLVGQFVSVSTTAAFVIGQQTFKIQSDLLDKIMPGLLPLTLTLICWWFLRRGTNPLKLVLGVAVVGLVGGLVHLF